MDKNSDQSHVVPSKDLTKEEGLFQIWWQSRRLGDGWFNWLCAFATLSLSIMCILFTGQTTSQIAESIRQFCDLGMGFASSVLGFLVAGLAIFASFTHPDMMVMMSRMQHKPSGLSYIKYNYFALLRVLSLYTLFVGMCFFMNVIAIPHGAIAKGIRLLSRGDYDARWWFVRIAFVIVITAFCYIILELKSFIFNVYHIIITGVRWEREKHDQEAEHDNQVIEEDNTKIKAVNGNGKQKRRTKHYDD